MRNLAQVYKAFSDETRLQILALLLHHGELCVCDVEKALDITQSKASRHLRYLLHTGLVEDRREGVWIHYRITAGLGPEAREVLKSLRHLLTGDRMGELEQRLLVWQVAKQAGAAACGDEVTPVESPVSPQPSAARSGPA